ncbi:SDR family oxidoreductase [Sphingomonas cannabina]|uniref:NAD-dependent epimerase/dehydratase family protein n=1 Tax=Sphingomonas cannabina TaxID=2899123 RepID=UPI001F468478|nr:SDR family oxidoreductase [Sphingomonas cannabina]UIJ44004.1 SDR family oxidoreductase [Sphingomonas cannabina]
MKILVTGNMGYVGPAVVRRLRARYPDAVIHGYDSGFFAHCLTTQEGMPERRLDCQIFDDVRNVRRSDLDGYDAVILLAAISNDPMGERFSAVTRAVNQDAAVSIARAASAAGVRNLVFASSCSVYGVADGPPRREEDPVDPRTAYAASKVGTEQALSALDGDMTITCLRFATACGMSDRLRLDLVLNDFVASALSKGRIEILSDGTPWRPMIDTADMARAIDWAATRPAENGGRYLIVNVGANEANYRVRDLAEAVAAAVPGCTVSLNREAPVDSRSYRVDFSRYAELAPDHLPQVSLATSVQELIAGLSNLGFADRDFRSSGLIRLQTLKQLIAEGQLSEDLTWTRGAPRSIAIRREEVEA